MNAVEAALRAAPLGVTDAPESDWPELRARWDRVERAARLFYQTDHPSKDQLTVLVGQIEIAEALLRSRHDPVLALRLAAMLGKKTTGMGLAHAAVLLRALQAELPG